jgi:hypothetical protein
MAPDDLNALLKHNLGDLAVFLFPDGKQIDATRFKDSESGVTITLTGLKRGVWTDAELYAPEINRNLLALYARRFNYLNLEGWEVRAAREAGAWLEASFPSGNGAQPPPQEPARIHAPAFDLPEPERPAPLPPQQQRKEPPMEREAPKHRITYPQDFHREFPQAPDAEKGVLGSIAVVPDCLDRALEAGIAAASFYIPAHGLIFEAFIALRKAEKPIEFITLLQYLQDRAQLAQVGGPAVLSELFLTATAANLNYYADLVLEKQLLRDAIAACAEFSARGYEEQHDPAGLVAEMAAAMEKIATGRARNGKPLVSLMDVDAGTPDPRATVLGDRFLCIGGTMLFVGPSGIGKSSASVQQDILWSVGLPAFGIRPGRPLKILTIQAENDAEDLAEMRDGVLKGLRLTPSQIEQSRGNLFYETECGLTGEKFLAHVARRLAREQFDILRIDPLLAYLGADVNDAEATAAFLRAGLNPLLVKYKCACIINHHTPKVVNRDTANWRGSDWMYSGAGSADITNWARAIMVIDPTHVGHIFQFIAAKRGGRTGWVSEEGEKEFKRPFCHATDGIYWREATDEDALQLEGELENRKGGPRKTPKTADDVLRILPPNGALGINSIIAIAGEAGIGEKKTRGYIASLVHTGRAFQHRPAKDPSKPQCKEWRYGRKPEELV